MAEGIVKFVVGKLADVAVREVLSLYGVDAQVETVSRELGRMQAFLKDAGKKQITNESQKHWLKEVTDLAYSIEDVIDIFLLEVPQKPQKSTGMTEEIKRMMKKAKKLPAVHNLVVEISQIQEKLKEIEQSRLRYGIENLGEAGTEEIQRPIKPPIIPTTDPEVIGLKKERNHIIKELLNQSTKRRAVVSISGTGGLGKTTLAQKVYNSNDVKKRFGLRIWVVISQNFQQIDTLRKMIKQVYPSIDESKLPKDGGDLLTMLDESLRGKKYLIVLDDIWKDDQWTQIGVAFPDENNGSRILITTRSHDVAKGVDPTREPFKLEYLTNKLSFQLLFKKALPNLDPKNSAIRGLFEIMNQFVHKCGGLPLALVVVGGLLSKKPCNYNAWSKVLNTMSWHDDGNICGKIISTSFEALPFALKPCFMYFSAFPEDYKINARNLIQLWVAEGFIPQEDTRTLEETAESFLEDLVQRSLVLVKSRSIIDGSIESCGIHDLLRDLAVRKAKEDNFLEVYSHPDDKQSIGVARRLAVHHLDCEELVMSQNLRTLLCFCKGHMPNCSKQRLLKVVSTGTSIDTKIKLEMFEGLTQLRYLDLIGESSDNHDQVCLEKVIGAMKFLQTFSMHFKIEGKYMNYPDCVWRINTLRHVNGLRVPHGLVSKDFEVPPSAKLTNLQTLSRVIIKEHWENGLPGLPNLRRLELRNKISQWGGLTAFLRTLKHLIALQIHGNHIPLDMRGFPFYENLRSLILINSWHGEMSIDISMFPPHLTSLSLSNFEFPQDVMSILENLAWLKDLKLEGVSIINRTISCSAKGFSQLELLQLSRMPSLGDWKIEEGSMPILRELKISFCAYLCVPQGLQYLTSLQNLAWTASGRQDAADEIKNLYKDVIPSIRICK